MASDRNREDPSCLAADEMGIGLAIKQVDPSLIAIRQKSLSKVFDLLIGLNDLLANRWGAAFAEKSGWHP
jgi:hypothetical protein